MNLTQDILELGFDRFQRFRAAGRMLNELGRGKALKVMEAGSLDSAFEPFAGGHKITAYPELIRPGSPVAYPDGVFDASLALDVLEHVQPEERPFFLSELCRVSRLGMVLGFPVKQAEEAERFVLGLTKSPWLKEHEAFGLPDPAEVEAILTGLGLSFDRRPNAALASWVPMMLLMYGTDPATRARISAFFNRHFVEQEDREPAYRFMYLCRKN